LAETERSVADPQVLHRDLWREIMHYGAFDRMPVIHWKTWPETLERWQQEGLPPEANQGDFFNARFIWAGVGPDIGLCPPFSEETIEETSEYRIFRDREGVVKQDWKHRSCIPHFIDFTLKTADDWPKYKRRLQPHPDRIPGNFSIRVRGCEQCGLPVAVRTAPMMGWIRNWMGVQNMAYLMFDAPDCYADMVNTLADLTCWAIDETVSRMTRPPDLGFGWEDICGSSGPLVSPEVFDRYVAPGYRKIRRKLEEHGVTIYGIDSDGMVEPLIPHWLEAGVNLQFPLQPGHWGATPERMRRRFGRELRIVGGFDKLALEKGRASIDAEIERHVPVMKGGGFVIMPDHLITPDVPLEDYRYYIERIRALRL
jgi:uroporphyrinogen decarboxylase